MSETARPAIALKAVQLSLGNNSFRFDCSFERGAVTAVVGPSGSGKSTLLNLVSGFEQPESGTVEIDGVDVSRLTPAERPISLIFQDNNLFAHLDLFTNVGLGIHPALKLTEEDRAAITRALARVGLPGFEKRMPASLSGGERQRATIARALVRRRPILLLDEPLSGLDPALRSAMVELIAELQVETAATMLLITHEPRDIKRLAKNVVFLQNGRVLLAAAREEFFRRDDLEAVRQFLGESDTAAISP